MSGRTDPTTVASNTTTTTSDVMTNARVKVASGPLARVCDRMPSVADGLRVTANAPQSNATPTSAPVESERVNGMSDRAARNAPLAATRTKTHCSSVAHARLFAPLRIAAKSSSAPPASAMSDSASVLTGDRFFTVGSSTSRSK
jgi:hypothetical protein